MCWRISWELSGASESSISAENMNEGRFGIDVKFDDKSFFKAQVKLSTDRLEISLKRQIEDLLRNLENI